MVQPKICDHCGLNEGNYYSRAATIRGAVFIRGNMVCPFLLIYFLVFYNIFVVSIIIIYSRHSC